MIIEDLFLELNDAKKKKREDLFLEFMKIQLRVLIYLSQVFKTTFILCRQPLNILSYFN